MRYLPPEIYWEILVFATATAAEYRDFQLTNKEWQTIMTRLCPKPKEMFAKIKTLTISEGELRFVTNGGIWNCCKMRVPVLPNGQKHGIGIRNIPKFGQEHVIFRDDTPTFAIGTFLSTRAIITSSTICIDSLNLQISVDDTCEIVRDKVLKCIKDHARVPIGAIAIHKSVM